MLTFANGLSIDGNPHIIKTNFGVKITNDLGLNIELSDSVWDSFNKIK